MPDFDAGDPCEISFDHTKGDREELCPNGCGERLRIYSSHAWEVDNSGEWHSHERCIARLKVLVQSATAFWRLLVGEAAQRAWGLDHRAPGMGWRRTVQSEWRHRRGAKTRSQAVDTSGGVGSKRRKRR